MERKGTEKLMEEREGIEETGGNGKRAWARSQRTAVVETTQ
jgi:hypothetical protein